MLRPLLMLALFCTVHIPIKAHAEKTTPIEITVDGTLEWHRNQRFFLANKNAQARQGETKIKADKLTALYDETTQESGFDIHTLRAEGSVKISAQDSEARSENASYNVKTQIATMHGAALIIETPDQTLTAQDHFEYNVAKGQLTAFEDATIIRPKPKGGEDHLQADKIIATFKTNEQGKRVLEQMEAVDNVFIKTPTEIITGNYAVYHAQTNTAEMSGAIRIRRGPNVLEGERAVIDLNTSISTLYGAKNNNKRVRGVFFPGSEKRR